MLIVLLGVCPEPVRASTPGEQLPTLRAHSRTFDLREGRRLWPAEWHADPALALDDYVLSAVDGVAHFALLGDQDSIVLAIPAGTAQEFYIVLDGRDSCRTRVTAIDAGMKSTRAERGLADTLGFELGRDGRPYFTGTVNGSRPVRLMFDAGGGASVLGPRAIKKGARFVPADTVANVGGGGTVLRPVGRAHQLTIETANWEHVEFIRLEKDFSDADGLVGWRLFDGRIAAFDFVQRRVIAGDTLGAIPEGYQAVPLRWMGALPAIEVEIDSAGIVVTELLQLDTGSNSALRLTAGAAHWGHYDASFRKLGEGSSRGMGPRVRTTRRVEVPRLRIAGFELARVASELELPMDGEEPGASHLGMGVLGRFDLILDLRNDQVYLRPNARWSMSVGPSGPRDSIAAIAVSIIALALAASAGVAYRRARRTRA
ncbi:MAG: aspartyl protease family protein [Candidatus Eisenbacteria bacterium]